jgi:NADPH:quinone reductase-like Zn-dependent oxidoreductase
LPIPELKEGQLLIKVEASTVNPSDRAKLAGFYMPEPLPIVLGLEGVGRVEKVAGEGVQDWVGKRVSFLKAGSGTWGEYSVAIPHLAFPVEEDLPVETAASGVVNPLTVVGMTDIYQKFPGHKGIIHTAAASALGRMLNKRCQRLGIPLLNIVRRQEQADLLRSEGAQHVIITTGDW